MSGMGARNLGYRYPGSDRWILRRIDFSVAPGEVVHVVGRNGSGKSTLLKLLSGFLPPTEGSIVREPGCRVAYMNQDSGDSLASDLTVQEQLAAMTRRNSPLASRLLSWVKEFDVGLQGRMDDFVGHLSGGQRQIVALLCTIMSGATNLCLDEFTSAMDVNSAKCANMLLAELKGLRTSLVLVSHTDELDGVDRVFRLSSMEE